MSQPLDARPPQQREASFPESHAASVGRLERSFVALAVGDVLARGAAFAATVYLARALGADRYGVIALAAAITLYPAGLADFGIVTLGSREVAHDPARARALASALITGRVLIACGAAAGMAALAYGLLGATEAAVFVGYAVTLPAVGLNATWILVGLEEPRPAGVARVAGALLALGAIFLFVRGPADVARVPLAVLVGELCTVWLVLIAAERRGFRIRPHWDPAAVGPVFRRALPLVGHTLLSLSIFNADLVLVRIFRDRAALGSYAAAYALVTLLVNLGVIYAQSLAVALTRLRADGQDGALLQTSYARLFAIALPAALGGAALAPRIIDTFFGTAYGGAALALVVLLASVPIAALRSAATAALISRGGGGMIFRVTAFAAAAATVLGLALIPGLGILGAALATVATEAAHAFWSLRAARELGFAAMEPRRFLVPSLAGALMVGVVLAVAARPLWVAVPVGALVYAGALAAFGALRLRPDGMPALRV